MFTTRFAVCAPGFGAPKPALYAAAVDMTAGAENHGCIAALLCEHHASDDPVRLAEDLSVLDIISNGRVSVVFGIGYRPEEYDHFGVDIRERGVRRRRRRSRGTRSVHTCFTMARPPDART